MLKKLMLVGLLMSNNVYTMSPEDIKPEPQSSANLYVKTACNIALMIAFHFALGAFGGSCVAPDVACSAGN